MNKQTDDFESSIPIVRHLIIYFPLTEYRSEHTHRESANFISHLREKSHTTSANQTRFVRMSAGKNNERVNKMFDLKKLNYEPISINSECVELINVSNRDAFHFAKFTAQFPVSKYFEFNLIIGNFDGSLTLFYFPLRIFPLCILLIFYSHNCSRFNVLHNNEYTESKILFKS